MEKRKDVRNELCRKGRRSASGADPRLAARASRLSRSGAGNAADGRIPVPPARRHGGRIPTRRGRPRRRRRGQGSAAGQMPDVPLRLRRPADPRRIGRGVFVAQRKHARLRARRPQRHGAGRGQAAAGPPRRTGRRGQGAVPARRGDRRGRAGDDGRRLSRRSRSRRGVRDPRVDGVGRKQKSRLLPFHQGRGAGLHGQVRDRPDRQGQPRRDPGAVARSRRGGGTDRHRTADDRQPQRLPDVPVGRFGVPVRGRRDRQRHPRDGPSGGHGAHAVAADARPDRAAPGRDRPPDGGEHGRESRREVHARRAALAERRTGHRRGAQDGGGAVRRRKRAVRERADAGRRRLRLLHGTCSRRHGVPRRAAARRARVQHAQLPFPHRRPLAVARRGAALFAALALGRSAKEGE